MASDFNPTPIITEHWRSIGGAVVLNLFLAVGSGFLAWRADGTISSEVGAAGMTVAGLLSAFFLQLSIQAWDRASAWAESEPEPGAETTDHGRLLRTMAANAAYGMLVAFATAGIALAGLIVTSKGWQERAITVALVVAFVHLGLTVLLVGVRTFHLTRQRIGDATTGAVRSKTRQ